MENIDPRRLLVKIAGILEELKIPYLITGGIAVLVWGRPRFTADIDIVVELKEEQIKKLAGALRQVNEKGYIDEPSIEFALLRQGEFNYIDGETGVKVDFWILKDDPFDRSRLRRKVAKKILGRKVYLTSPEDLVLIKLKWYKESQSDRQLEDVKSILAISKKELDRPYLNLWAKRLGVSSEFKKVLKKF